MKQNLAELWRFRELLLAMTERELRIRYKNSVLGFLWSLVNPLATILVMTLVFRVFLRNETENYSVYVLAAYLPFIFLQFCMLDAAQSVLTQLPVIKKVYFPREILPISTILSNFVHYLLALGVFFAYLFVVYAVTGFEVSPFTWKMLFLPVLLVINLALAAGAALIVSALNVFYEDVKYIVNVGLYLMFFLTPILYFSENVYYALKDQGQYGELLYQIYHLNPIAMLATTYKKTLLPPGQIDIGGERVPALPFDWTLFGICVIVCFATLIGGYALFNRLKWKFVERP